MIRRAVRAVSVLLVMGAAAVGLCAGLLLSDDADVWLRAVVVLPGAAVGFAVGVVGWAVTGERVR